MAGETKGELAEAVASIALEQALRLLKSKDRVFWEKSPDCAVIKPDFTIGSEPATPKCLILVNASESPRNSDIKYWRNVGEIFDAKSRLADPPAVLNLVFQSEIKPELVRMIQTISDTTCLVDREDFGADIVRWMDENHADAPSNRSLKADLVAHATSRSHEKYDQRFAKAMKEFVATLANLLYSKKAKLFPLWDLCRADFQQRSGNEARPSKVTLLRRGLARWLVFDDEVRESVFVQHIEAGLIKLEATPGYAIALGMLQRRPKSTYMIPVPSTAGADNMVGTVARDLRKAADFLLAAANGDSKLAGQSLNDSLGKVPAEMSRAAEALRSVSTQITQWHHFVLTHWGELISPNGCFALLAQCADDPTMSGQVSFSGPKRVWIWDHLVALLRAAEDKDNNFGYGAMMAKFKTDLSSAPLSRLFRDVILTLEGRVQKAAVRWVQETAPTSAEPGRRGFQDWLARKKDVSLVVVAAFAYALSQFLTSISSPEEVSMELLVDAHFYGLYNKLLTHQDFEPLPTVIETGCGHAVTRTKATGLMAELAKSTVQDAGQMPVYEFDGGYIFWQSATEAGRDHKRKELSGRARALRFQFASGTFSQRPAAQRLILVLDGEWRPQDLQVLYESGWDEIYYPDEMAELARAIQ